MVALNLLLVVSALALGWMLRLRFLDQRAREQAVRRTQAQTKPVIAPPAPIAPRPIAPAQYFDVADKTLFAKDRNPTVVVEPPPPPPPPPPMPDLPVYHGQMAFGEPVAFLSAAKIAERGVHAGETIGDFKLVRFDRDRIAFEWQGKTIEKRVEELQPKETKTAVASGVASGAPADFVPANQTTAGSASRGVKSLGPADGKGDGKDEPAQSDDPLFGPVRSDGTRECAASDSLPSGATHNGYKKVSMLLLVGLNCYWEKTK